MGKKLKICLTASAGGHLSELLKVAACWEGYDTFCVTTTEVVRKKVNDYGNVYVVGECNYKHPVRCVRVFIRCVKAVFSERPDVVISAGAAGSCMVCYLAKMFGAKVVWLDSIANIKKLSLSGRLVRPVANLLLTQWPELAKKYKKAEYVGSVI